MIGVFIFVLLFTCRGFGLAEVYLQPIAGNLDKSTKYGVPATSTGFNYPYGIWVDSIGQVYYNDLNEGVVNMINTEGLTELVLSGVFASGMIGDTAGSIYLQAFDNVLKLNLSAKTTEVYCQGIGSFGYKDLWLDTMNTLYVLNPFNTVRAISSSGNIRTVAGIYDRLSLFSGDGGPATSAHLNNPTSAYTTKDGTLFIADRNNYRIRKVNTDGIITTYAGSGGSGNGAYSGDGGPATLAKISWVYCIRGDSDGNIYFGDFNNYRIRKVDTNGIISSVIGNGVYALQFQMVPLSSATIEGVNGLYVSTGGDIFFSDIYEISRTVTLQNSAPVQLPTALPPTTSSASGSSSNGSNVISIGAIIGIVAGVVVLLVSCSYYYFFCYKKKVTPEVGKADRKGAVVTQVIVPLEGSAVVKGSASRKVETV